MPFVFLRVLCGKDFWLGHSPCLRASAVKIGFPIPAIPRDHGDHPIWRYNSSAGQSPI